MMKSQLRTILIATLMVAILFACEKNDPLPEPDAPGCFVLTEKSAKVLDAGQRFGFELFKEVHELSEGENMMISSLSTSYALGMTYNGSAGSTRETFRDVLHYGELDDQGINESYKDLMGQLLHLDKQVEFSIANSIWYKKGFTVLEPFISTNQDYFDAAVEELDFSDPGAKDIINGWIEDKTNDKIQDMLDFIPSSAVMYLVNAIYYNAKWKYQFDPEETLAGDFHKADGSVSQAEFMKVNGAFNLMAGEGFSAVELPYGDSTFSMVVMLPAWNSNLDKLVEGLDEESWENLLSRPGVQNVRIEIPKFKYGFKSLLNDPLINLGLGVAFGGGADFSRITPGGGIYISRVIHQTFIDVQEEGTEAAAATIVELKESVSPGGGSSFKADRPFLYMIKENSTSAILFMGKVEQPEYE
jgi:serine protease inhibitor